MASGPLSSIDLLPLAGDLVERLIQVMGLNWPEPLGPVRRSGVAMRSGEFTRSLSRLTLPQAKPAVYG